ncbi:MAG: hypothetical protein HQ512_13515 [Rhodospirillales bacterium]|nr:hypothetical protein [Rhodospirillales bacterium]
MSKKRPPNSSASSIRAAFEGNNNFASQTRAILENQNSFASPTRAILENQNSFASQARAILESQNSFASQARAILKHQNSYASQARAILEATSGLTSQARAILERGIIYDLKNFPYLDRDLNDHAVKMWNNIIHHSTALNDADETDRLSTDNHDVDSEDIDEVAIGDIFPHVPSELDPVSNLTENTPPRIEAAPFFPTLLLDVFLPRDMSEMTLGDILEVYHNQKVPQQGLAFARLWFWGMTFRVVGANFWDRFIEYVRARNGA